METYASLQYHFSIASFLDILNILRKCLQITYLETCEIWLDMQCSFPTYYFAKSMIKIFTIQNLILIQKSNFGKTVKKTILASAVSS